MYVMQSMQLITRNAMHVYIYARVNVMYGCIYACMRACMYVCMHVVHCGLHMYKVLLFIHVCNARMYAMYVCMCVRCMYECMHVHTVNIGICV